MSRAIPTSPSAASSILCFDFDGTMVDAAGQPPLHPELMLYVEHLRQRGAVWVVNTGRTIFHTLEGLHEYGFSSRPDFIVAQESQLLQPGRFDRWVDVGDWNRHRDRAFRKVLKKGKKFFQSVRRFVESETDGRYFERENSPDEIIASSEPEMDRISAFIRVERKKLKLEFIGFERNTIYLRFGHTDFSKGTALGALCEHLKLGPEQVFAAGDNHNDLPMLSRQFAHALACPSNALPPVREAVEKGGGYVAKSSHGQGMIEALGHFFFR